MRCSRLMLAAIVAGCTSANDDATLASAGRNVDAATADGPRAIADGPRAVADGPSAAVDAEPRDAAPSEGATIEAGASCLSSRQCPIDHFCSGEQICSSDSGCVEPNRRGVCTPGRCVDVDPRATVFYDDDPMLCFNACAPGTTSFINACGCGCFADCPDPNDPAVDYVAYDQDACLRDFFPTHCELPRFGFASPQCGCGCVALPLRE